MRVGFRPRFRRVKSALRDAHIIAGPNRRQSVTAQTPAASDSISRPRDTTSASRPAGGTAPGRFAPSNSISGLASTRCARSEAFAAIATRREGLWSTKSTTRPPPVRKKCSSGRFLLPGAPAEQLRQDSRLEARPVPVAAIHQDTGQLRVGPVQLRTLHQTRRDRRQQRAQQEDLVADLEKADTALHRVDRGTELRAISE